MPDITYKVEFELTEPPVEETTTQSVDKSLMPKKNPAKKGFIEKKTAKAVMLSYGVYKTTQTISTTRTTNNMTLRGDNLAAKMFQERQARTDRLVGTAFSIGMSVAVKGTLGLLFIGMEAFKLASEAVNIAMANKNLLDRSRQEKYANALEQARFVRNTTTEKIKW